MLLRSYILYISLGFLDVLFVKKYVYYFQCPMMSMILHVSPYVQIHQKTHIDIMIIPRINDKKTVRISYLFFPQDIFYMLSKD